jgi:hypothetical protein
MQGAPFRTKNAFRLLPVVGVRSHPFWHGVGNDPQGRPVSRKRIPIFADFPPSLEPQCASALNYVSDPMSSGLLLTTKVGAHGSRA